MATNISFKINLSKIDKSKLYVGEKGVYLDGIIIMRDEPDEYQNSGMIVQNGSEEDRKAGIKGAILGNVKYLAKKEISEGQKQEAVDDLPF